LTQAGLSNGKAAGLAAHLLPAVIVYLYQELLILPLYCLPKPPPHNS